MTTPNAPDAAGALDATGGTPPDDDSAQQAPPASSDGTFFIPADVLGGKKYKSGDTITLEVKGEDQDGDLEVAMAASAAGDESGGGDWRTELKSKLADAGTETGGPNG